MERAALRRPVLVNADADPLALPVQETLAATATYALSDTGRKASLLAGGTGRAVQQVVIDVPAQRLHLVHVNGRGQARLTLRPRYERQADQRLVVIDAPPIYDAPPTAEELLRDAAHRHQLERASHAERTAARTRRADTDRTRRADVATAFLHDPAQRAQVHPAPSARRCVLITPAGPVTFDATTDDGLAKDVPPEALRRFRADLVADRERRARERTEHVRVHEARTQAMAAWVAAHGTEDQRARHAAGLLPMAEAVECLTDAAFRALANRPRYVRDGAAVLQAHVRQCTGHAPETVGPKDFAVVGHAARTATAEEWAVREAVQAAVPHATVTLHVREFLWRRDPGVPRLIRRTLVVTQAHGPFTLRREYPLAEEDMTPHP